MSFCAGFLCVTAAPWACRGSFSMCASENVSASVLIKPAAVFLNVIGACSNQAPLVMMAVSCSFLAQKGPSDLDLLPEEYSVMIGSYPCNISFHNDQLFHCTIDGLRSSRERELPVTVRMQARCHKKDEK